MPKRKTVTTIAQKKLKRDIKKAASDIPNLIAKSITFEVAPIVIAPKNPLGRWLWVAVMSMTAVVFAMWYQNTRQMVRQLNVAQSVEAGIAADALSDFEATIAAVAAGGEAATASATDETSEQVRAILSEQLSTIPDEINTYVQKESGN